MALDVPPGGTRGARGTPSGPIGRMFMGLGRVVHRLTGSKMGGRPLLYLSTGGAKSHPSWFYNLAAHPDQVEVEVEGRKTAVTPQTLTGEERATAWQRITS